MKRIVICSDGTWNSPDQMDRGQRRPSNVAKTALAVLPEDGNGVRQLVFYDKGVGTTWYTQLPGGALGYGLSRNIEDAYRFLMAHYEAGDEVYFFGFSRGAYTVRSTAGLIRNCGLLHQIHADVFEPAYRLYRRRDDESHPSSVEAALFKKTFAREVPIHFMGVWDTVGALGIPLSWFGFLNRRWHFHDVTLSRSVRNAFQALAIDERRGPFKPSIWHQQPDATEQVLEQMWFAGVHTNVGGGYADTGLSDIAFQWMKEKAEGCGLAFDTTALDPPVDPNALGELRDSKTGIYRLFPECGRPIADANGAKTNESVHETAIQRLEESGDPAYAPANLVEYLKRAKNTAGEASVP